MFQSAVDQRTIAALEKIKNWPLLQKFYLAGGTGLALQLGHRLSNDLDFFSQEGFQPPQIAAELNQYGSSKLIQEAEGTLETLFENTRLSFFYYNYPLLKPLLPWQNIFIADVQDIACMKLAALSHRGLKKDFVDVYFITQEVMPMDALLELFFKKYRAVNYDRYHLLKSLAYFDDAEKEPLPKMLKEFDWKRAKEFFADFANKSL